MSINASNYVVSYKTPNVPNINVNVKTVTQEKLEQSITVYQSAASAYVDEYRAVVTNRDYVQDRLQKDLCGSVDCLTNGGINYHDNTIQLHVKANDVFAYATSGGSFAYAGGIAVIESKFKDFCSKFYMDDEQSNCILQSSFESATEYDGEAFTVTADINGTVSSGTIFIVNEPNKIGTTRTYTSYTVSNEPEFLLFYDRKYAVDSETSGAWVVKEAGESGATVAYSVSSAIDENVVWIDL